MADRRSDESLGPKRLCKTEDCAEPTLSSRVPAHLALVIAVVRTRRVADPGCGIRTSDHLSVLVTAFLRRGKPRSGLKLTVRVERQASKDIAARQKPELRALGSAWRCSPADAREGH